MLVAGVDGYRKGWVAVSLDPSGDVEVSTHVTFAEVLSLRAQRDRRGHSDRSARARRAAGRRGGAGVRRQRPREQRLPDPAARGARSADVRGGERDRANGHGKGISQQAFALGKKILEVHALAEVDERVIEMHPEVSFCELSGAHVLESKHTPEGLERRRAILADAGIRLPGAVPGVPEADLLDAAAGAWTAARYSAGKAQPVPAGHTDRLGAIWR